MMGGPALMPTEELVRRTLHEKGVEIRYFVDTKTGNPSLPDFSLRVDGWKKSDSRASAALCFPIAPHGTSPVDMRELVHGFGQGDPPGPALTQEVLERHYFTIEPRVIVQPFLALAQVSREALAVLLGDWQVYEPMGISNDGAIDMVEHVLFRMVFAAIRDLSESRTVPDESVVREARVSGVSNLAQRHGPPLLEIVLKDNSIIGYNAGFDTSHLFYQGEDDGPEDVAEVMRNPEDCWVDVWWDCQPPSYGDQSLEGRIGYSFDDSGILKRLLLESEALGTKVDRPPMFKQAAWLGDMILNAWTTSALLARMTSERTNKLAPIRDKLVSNESLAVIGRAFGLKVNPKTQSTAGEEAMRAAETGMLGDSVEALIGAAYMDGGLKAAHRVVWRIMMRPLEAVAPVGTPLDFYEGKSANLRDLIDVKFE